MNPNTICRTAPNGNGVHYQVIDDPTKGEWSEQDHKEFEKLSAPLVEFIQQRHDKCNPYSWIIIQWNGVAFMPNSHWYPFKVPD